MNKKILRSGGLLIALLFFAFFICLFCGRTAVAQETQSASSSPTLDLEKIKNQIQNNSQLSDDQKQELLRRLQTPADQSLQVAPGTVDCFSFYRFGSVGVSLNVVTSSVFVGNKAEFTAVVTNDNDYPIVEGNLWAQIFRNNPEGEAKNGNHLIDQFLAADNINLNPKESKTLNFSYDLTKDLPEGKYYLAAFFTASKRYEISGLTFVNNIYASNVSFDVKSPEQKAIYIDRNNVQINGQTVEGRSPVISFKEGTDVKINFSFVNEKTFAEQVKLTYALYLWDTLRPENIVNTSSEAILVDADSAKSLEYVIPKIQSGTYQLRITAEYPDAKSMFEVRLTSDNVKRGRVNFAAIDKFPLVKDDKGKMFACFHNAGNGLGYDGEVILALKDAKGNVVAQKEYKGFIAGEVRGLEQDFQASSKYDYLVLTATVKDKNGKVVDEASTVYGNRPEKTTISSVLSKWQYAVGALIVILLVVFLLAGKMRKKTVVFLAVLAAGLTLFVLSANVSMAACGPSYSFNVSGYGYVGLYTHFGFGGTVNMDQNCLFKRSNGACIKNGDALNVGDVISFADLSGEWNGWGSAWGTPPFSKIWYAIGSGTNYCGEPWPACCALGQCPDSCSSLDSVYGRAFIKDRTANITADNAGLVRINGESVTAVQSGAVTLTTSPTLNVRNQHLYSMLSVNPMCSASDIPFSLCTYGGRFFGGGGGQSICFDPADPPHSGAYSAVGPAGYVGYYGGPSGSGVYYLSTVDRTVNECPMSVTVNIISPCTSDWSSWSACSNHQQVRHDNGGCLPDETRACNLAPVIKNFTGPEKGNVNTSYTYTATAEDPEYDRIRYQFQWKKKSDSDWNSDGLQNLGGGAGQTLLVGSGQSADLTHAFSLSGSFMLRVRVTDQYGLSSDWSSPIGISVTSNRPPTATPNPPIQPNYCLPPTSIALSWTYNDPDIDKESKFQLQIANDSGFNSLTVDRTFDNLNNPNGGVNNQSVLISPSPAADQLGYNKNYYWRVMVWDSRGLASSWATGQPFSTPVHVYPAVDFGWQPSNPDAKAKVAFSDQSAVYGGATKSSWSWTFQSGSPDTSSDQNPTVTFNSSGSRQVSLRLTDSNGLSCVIQKTLKVNLPFPTWKEIKPF